jgi:hypothetical protein
VNPERPWTIDVGLARDLAAAVGWRPDDGVAALASAMPTAVPMGSTAKLAAIADGEVPPGADVEALARQLLAHCHAVATGPVGGAPSPTWSCWVAATVMAALVGSVDLGPVQVAATRRCDDAAPPVDFHASVTVTADDRDWICDPYFGVSIALPHGPGGDASSRSPIGTASASRSADGGWDFFVGLDVWDQVLRFRRFGPALDRGDVEAMAAISVTHSGVPLRPYARLHVGDGIVDASESADSTAVVHTWTASTGRVARPMATWADAVSAFAERTGTRVI